MLERPVAVLRDQEAHRVDRGVLAAAQFEGAVGPVRQAMVRAEGQRVHRRMARREHYTNNRFRRYPAQTPITDSGMIAAIPAITDWTIGV